MRAEFVEAALLRQYRREHQVRLQEIREFVSALRAETGVPYPLAHYRPWVGEGCRLLLEMQEKSQLPGELWLVAPASDQIVLTDPAASFLKRVEWEDDLPVAWKPHEDDSSPVRCQPTMRFGLPSIGRISTEVIVADEAGPRRVTGVQSVRWGHQYEKHADRGAGTSVPAAGPSLPAAAGERWCRAGAQDPDAPSPSYVGDRRAAVALSVRLSVRGMIGLRLGIGTPSKSRTSPRTPGDDTKDSG